MIWQTNVDIITESILRGGKVQNSPSIKFYMALHFILSICNYLFIFTGLYALKKDL